MLAEKAWSTEGQQAMSNLDELRDEPLIGEVAYRIDEATIRPLLFHDFVDR
jgi:hypothetical protein